MADNQESIVDSTSIPKVLVTARLYIRLLRYKQSLFQELTTSLTLAGIFLVLVQISLPTEYVGLLYTAALVFPFLFVPAVHIYFENDNDRSKSIRQLKSSQLETEFYYVIYHIINFTKKLSVDVDKARSFSERKSFIGGYLLQRCKQRSEYRATNQYPILLVNNFYDRFGFSNPDQFLQYLRFKPDYIRATVNRYYNALESNEPNSQNIKLTSAADEMTTLLTDLYDVLRNPIILFEAMKIITAPGTGDAVEGLTDALCAIRNNKYGGENACSSSEYIENLVDKSRGFSLSTLADLDLKNWRIEKCEKSPVKANWREARRTAKINLGNKFKDFIEKDYKDNDKLTILTTSYSTSVIQCLETIMDRIYRVYIIELGPKFRNDNQLMKQSLEAKGISASIINEELLKPDNLKDNTNLAITGFETINKESVMLHPRCIVKDLIDKFKDNVDYIVVGESWKVRDFDTKNIDLANTSATDTGKLAHVITDHRTHGKNEHLDCCIEYWEKQYSI